MANLTSASPPTFAFTSLMHSLHVQVKADELLFGAYQTRHYRLAPYLFDVERLSDFEARVQTGSLARVGFFAVKRVDGERGLATPFPLED